MQKKAKTHPKTSPRPAAKTKGPAKAAPRKKAQAPPQKKKEPGKDDMPPKATLTKREREKIKKWLLERRAQLLNDLDGTATAIDNLQDPKADDFDRAVEAGTMELLVTLGDTERRELEEITLALEKIASGTYGHCEACMEKPLELCATCPFIPKPRLEALPTARLCVACQEAEEKNQIPSYTRLRPRRSLFGEEIEEFSHPLMDTNDDN